jgi:hypothetical protein
LRRLLKDQSGLDLSADKQYLIESRLLPLARKSGLPDISALVQKLKAGAPSFVTQVIEAMTTNETFFFRDKIPVRSFPRIDHAGDAARACRSQEHPDLVRRGLDRTGAVFDRDVPEGDGCCARRLAD